MGNIGNLVMCNYGDRQAVQCAVTLVVPDSAVLRYDLKERFGDFERKSTSQDGRRICLGQGFYITETLKFK